ncbi:MAG TPA: hypothetical protein VFL83_17895 [Anaeromyxobacter sp.]|nr:hypothetical protein [Anaeromyxobacter sp.]
MRARGRDARGAGAERLLLGLAAALVLANALRLPAAWASGNALNHVSGAWMALADDLAHGTLYRPLHDAALGYGGTRYFPLVFAGHAALLRAGVGLLEAGWLLSAAAGALLVAGGFLLLRGLGLRRGPALAYAVLALGGFAAQHALSAGRGDLLPVALSALGLAAIARRAGRGRVALAAVLLALAFAAKPSALSAAAAGVAWLALRGRRRAAGALAAAVATLGAAVLGATDALSGGRFLAILRACAVDADLHGVARAPLRIAEELVVADPAGLILVVAAAVAVAVVGRPLARALGRGAVPAILLPALWLAAAAGAAVVVFASPGAGMNHLVEVEAAAALALGAASRDPAARFARLAAPVAAAAGVALALATWRADLRPGRLDELRATVRALPAGPVLSEDPTVPLLAGARPVVADPWMLRVAAAGDPALARGLADDLARGRYAAVVLFEDLDSPGAARWYAGRNLGLAIVAEIRAGYRPAGRIGRYHLYVPRARGSRRGEARLSAADDPPGVVTPRRPR